MAVAADATREEDAERAVRETIDRFGRVDVLVTLVGGSRGNPGIEAPEARLGRGPRRQTCARR